MSGLIHHLGTKSGIVNSGRSLSDQGILEIGNLRIQKITGTSGASASQSSGDGQSEWYINLTVSFGYTYPVVPLVFFNWGYFDSHNVVIASHNATTTGASAYAHSHEEVNIESKAFYCLVIGETA